MQKPPSPAGQSETVGGWNASGIPFHFKCFLTGDALTLAASVANQMILTWWVMRLGGAAALTLFTLLSAIVACILTPLAPFFAERGDRRRFILKGLWIYFFSSILLAWMATAGQKNIYAILLLDIMATASLSMTAPITVVIASEVVPERAASAYDLQRLVQSIGTTLGPALGGMLLAWQGIACALWSQIVVLALSLAMMHRLPPLQTMALASSKSAWAVEIMAGLRIKWRILLERYWTAISMVVGICLVPCDGLLLPLKVQSLNLGGHWLGICESAASFGMVLGVIAAHRSLNSGKIDRYWVRNIAHCMIGPALITMGYSRSAAVLVCAAFVIGVSKALILMVGFSRRILAAPSAYRARMTAVSLAQRRIAGIIGPTLVGIGLIHNNVPDLYLCIGVTLLACSFAYLMMPDFRMFMRLSDDNVNGWYERRYPFAFK
jgi:MFS family permease